MADATGLRIVTFNVLPPAYSIVVRWAKETGNTIVLVVTTPGPSTRRNTTYHGVVAQSLPGVDVLVTTRLRRVAAPLIRALEPDLLISATFPYRIPPEVRSLARLGAVNLHPTILPTYRGPNPFRQFYEGAPLIGATLHWTADEYDDGNILAQHSAPLPTNVTEESIFAVWGPTMAGALAEGVERAVAGDPGTVQDHARATYGAQFSDAEYWLDWAEPGATLQRKSVALNFGHPAAKARIAGQSYTIVRIDPLPDAPATDAAPGTVLARTADAFILRVGDGAAGVVATPLAAG